MSIRTLVRRGVLIPLIQTALSLGGCAVGPDFESPAAPAVSGYTAGRLAATQGADGPGGIAQRFAYSADVPAVWWQVFRSRQIEAFVREAIDNHPDLAAAQAALRQAREVAAADTSALLPSITGDSSATRNEEIGRAHV